MNQKYWFFIPVGNMVLHWENTLEGFREIVARKREEDKAYQKRLDSQWLRRGKDDICLFNQNPLIRVVNLEKGKDFHDLSCSDFHLSSLMGENQNKETEFSKAEFLKFFKKTT